MNSQAVKTSSMNASSSDIQGIKNTMGNGNRTPNSSFKNIGIGKKSDLSIKNSKETILSSC